MFNHSKAAAAAIPSGKKGAVESPDKAVARKIRTAIEQKELIKRSTLGLYSLKTKDSSFGLPFCAASDHFALLANKQLLPLSDCYKVGTFCLYDGKVSTLSRPVLVLDNKVN